MKKCGTSFGEENSKGGKNGTTGEISNDIVKHT